MAEEKTTATTERTYSYRYANSGIQFWDTGKSKMDLLLRVVTQEEPNRNSRGEMVIKITKLTEDNKFVKDENGKTDSATFNLTANEVSKLAYAVKKMFPSNEFKTFDEDAATNPSIYGVLFSHMNKEKNAGVSLDVLNVEEGIYVVIRVYKTLEEYTEYTHCLSSMAKIAVINEEGQVEEVPVNEDVVLFKEAVSSFTALSGLIPGIMEIVGTERRQNSTLNSNLKRPEGLNFRTRMMAKAATETATTTAAEREENFDDCEEGTPILKAKVKPVVKPSMTKRVSRISELLNDD